MVVTEKKGMKKMAKGKNLLPKVTCSALILAGVFTGMYIGANNIASVGAADKEDVVEYSQEANDIGVENDIVVASLDVKTSLDLDFIPRLAQNTTQNNQILLFNPTTGEIVATYEFGEKDFIYGASETKNGYFVIHVGEIDMFSHQLWAGKLDYVWEMDEDDLTDYLEENFPYIPESERNFRVVIFDRNLNVVDTLPGETEENNLNLWGSIVKFEDGILYVYSTLSIPDAVGESFGAFSIIPAYLRRLNLTTGEIDILFEFDNSMNLIEFIGENYILIDQVVDGTARTVRGAINLETGELIDLERKIVLEGEDVVTHLEASGVNLEAWVNFGNSLDYLEIYEWDTELLEYFSITFDDPYNFERLMELGFFSHFNGSYYFTDPSEFIEWN